MVVRRNIDIKEIARADALFQKIGGKAVPQGVNGNILVEAGCIGRLPARPLH